MIPYIILILYFVFKWCQDTVAHHYKESIFSDYEFFSNDWHRKYVDGDVNKGRKKLFWIFEYPVWLLDGWHFWGFWRNSMLLVFFAMLTDLYWVFDVIIYIATLNITMWILYKKNGLLIKRDH